MSEGEREEGRAGQGGEERRREIVSEGEREGGRAGQGGGERRKRKKKVSKRGGGGGGKGKAKVREGKVRKEGVDNEGRKTEIYHIQQIHAH